MRLLIHTIKPMPLLPESNWTTVRIWGPVDRAQGGPSAGTPQMWVITTLVTDYQKLSGPCKSLVATALAPSLLPSTRMWVPWGRGSLFCSLIRLELPARCLAHNTHWRTIFLTEERKECSLRGQMIIYQKITRFLWVFKMDLFHITFGAFFSSIPTRSKHSMR